MGRRLQLFELPAPTCPITGWNFDFLLQLLFGLGHKRADVTASHVGTDDDSAFAVLAADLIRAGSHFQAGYFGQWDIDGSSISVLPLRQWDRQAVDGIQIAAQVIWQSHD